MSAESLALRSRRQALTAILPVRAGSEGVLEAELRLRKKEWLAGLGRSQALHFAKLALLPNGPGAANLVLETSFEGSLTEHLHELWESSASTWSDLLRHCEGGTELDRDRFRQLIDRHAVRVAADCSAHDGFSRALIENDARLDQAVQRLLHHPQTARIRTGMRPLELVAQLQKTLSEQPEVWLGSVEPADSRVDAVAADDRGAGQGVRRLAVSLAWFGLRWLDFWGRRARGGASAPAPGDSESSAEVCLQSAWIAVSPPAHGRFRRWALSTLMRALAPDSLAQARVHALRWVRLADGRLLVSVTHDGSFSAFRARLPRTSAAYLSVHRVRFEARAQIWYSAYPELAVSDVLRNHRIRELFSRPLDESSARVLAALL